jgi:hypothetical protein
LATKAKTPLNEKSIALVGYTLSALAKPLTGLATAWPAVLGARFLDRVGAGTRSAPRDALIASRRASAAFAPAPLIRTALG